MRPPTAEVLEVDLDLLWLELFAAVGAGHLGRHYELAVVGLEAAVGRQDHIGGLELLGVGGPVLPVVGNHLEAAGGDGLCNLGPPLHVGYDRSDHQGCAAGWLPIQPILLHVGLWNVPGAAGVRPVPAAAFLGARRRRGGSGGGGGCCCLLLRVHRLRVEFGVLFIRVVRQNEAECLDRFPKAHLQRDQLGRSVIGSQPFHAR